MDSNHRHADSESAVLPAELPGTGSERLYHARGAGPCNDRPLQVAAAIGRGLAVAVRAEHAQIFEAVIVPYAVNVVEVHIERLSEPISQAAGLAAVS